MVRTPDIEVLLADYGLRRIEKGMARGFDCGVEDLNRFLRNSYHHFADLLLVTWALRHKKTREVIAFYSVLNDSITIHAHALGSNNKHRRFKRGLFCRKTS